MGRLTAAAAVMGLLVPAIGQAGGQPVPGTATPDPAGIPMGALPAVETITLDPATPLPSKATSSGGARLAAADAAVDSPVAARATGLADFALVGMSWTGEVDVHADLRVRRADGTWSPWRHVGTAGADGAGDDASGDGGDGPPPAVGDPAGRKGAEPVWVGRADGYELAVEGPLPADAQLHLVRLAAPPDTPGPAPEGALSGPAATAGVGAAGSLGPAGIPADSMPPLSSGVAPPPVIHSRAAWGARPVAGVDVAGEVRSAVVHHTADAAPYGYGPGDVPGMLRAIQAYHQDALGWWDIGYNFVVDRFGRIWEARTGGVSKAVIGAHAGGFNTATTGVAVLGDFSGVAADGAILEALTQVIAWKLFLDGADPSRPTALVARSTDRFAQGQVVPLPRIIGHRDVNATACPAGLYLALDGLRGAVAARYASFLGGTDLGGVATPDTPASARGHGGDFNGDGRQDVLWDTTGDSKVIWFGQPDGTVEPLTVEADPGLDPLIGDFDGDGTSDVLWHGSEQASLWYQWTGGWPRSSGAPAMAVPRSRGAVFDGDGDGDDDIVWYEPANGHTTTWISLGPAGFREVPTRGQPDARPVVFDPNGDGRDDVLWYRPGQLVHELWQSTGDFSNPVRPLVLPDDRQPAAGDFDGDGRDDLVLSGPSGTTVRWLDLTDSSELGVAGGFTPAVADVNGGGADELFLIDGAGTMVRFVGRSDRLLTGEVLPAPAGAVAIVGDVNGDARDDVRWHVDGGGGYNELWLAR